MPTPPYQSVNAAYQLHYHFRFGTRRNKELFVGSVKDSAVAILEEVCRGEDYHLLDFQLRGNWLEALLSLKPPDAIPHVVQMIKGNLSRHLFLEYPDLETRIGRRNLWAASYEVYTVGSATTSMIKAYLDSQRNHHMVTMQESRKLALYSAPDKESYLKVQKDGRAVYLLHYHFVLSVKDHAHLIDETMAQYLTKLMLRICEVKEYVLLSVEVLEDHMHYLLSLHPKDVPQVVAESVMNNTSLLTLQRFGALRPLVGDQLWTPSFFVRSVGRKTTAQVRSFLTRP